MLCRVVARSNADLQRVIDAIVDVEGVVRTSTVIALDRPLPPRVLPLIRAAISGSPAAAEDPAVSEMVRARAVSREYAPE